MSSLLPVYPVSALEYSDGATLDRSAYSATFHHVVDPASWTVWDLGRSRDIDGDAGSYAQAGEAADPELCASGTFRPLSKSAV